MRVRPRGFSEKLVYAFSPHPNVSDEEILKRAGLDLATPSTLSPFTFTWKFSSGLESETVILNPGDLFPLRESEAQEFLREAKELGYVIIEDPQDKAEVRRKTIEGLRAALAYWRDRGARRITDYRRQTGKTREDIEEMKHDLHPWFIAKAKAEVIAETLTNLNKKPTPKE